MVKVLKVSRTSASNPNIVGFGRRTLAFIIDMCIINLIIIYPFRGIFARYFGNLKLENLFGANAIAIPSSIYWALFFISVLALLYFSFFEYYLSQSPGKIIMKIRVISTTESDGSINLWNAILRNCFVIPFFPFYIFWAVDPIYFAFYKERLLEKLSSTKTVHVNENGFSSSKKYTEEYKLNKV